MAYQKKTWLARLGQGLNKFIFNGGSKVTLDSSPDVVTQEGTPLSAENMNDLEQRIEDEFTNVNGAITSLNTKVDGLVKTATASITIGNSVGTGYATYTLPVDGNRIIGILFETSAVGANSGLQLTPCNQNALAGGTGWVWYNRPTAGSDTGVIGLTIRYV